MRSSTLRSLRATLFVNALTVCLVLLVASPFTAPFKTWDLLALAGAGPLHDDGLSGEKASKEALPSLVDHAVSLVLAVLIPRARLVENTATPRTPLTVLRL